MKKFLFNFVAFLVVFFFLSLIAALLFVGDITRTYALRYLMTASIAALFFAVTFPYFLEGMMKYLRKPY